MRADRFFPLLKHEPAVKIEPENLAIGFTRRVPHDGRFFCVTSLRESAEAVSGP